MIAFVGLGNPGDNYANTKHNAGFWVVEEFAKRRKISFEPSTGDYLFAFQKRQELLLIKPTTGMNRSGLAVRGAVRQWSLLPRDIYIIVDDVDLPLGSVRIRPRGGDGCHRGLENVIYHMRSDEFPRVRLGIGTDENMRPAEKYVLKPFCKNNEQEAKAMVKRGADALENILIRGINYTMNHFNS